MYNYMIAQPDKMFWNIMFFVVLFIIDIIFTIIYIRKNNKRIKDINSEKDFLRMVINDERLSQTYRNFNKAMEEYNMIQKVIKNDR